MSNTTDLAALPLIAGVDLDKTLVRGRCKLDYNTTKCGAFAWPRSGAQLQDMRCPKCGGYLSPTTWQFRAGFHLLNAPDTIAIAAPYKARRLAGDKAAKAAEAAYRAANPEPPTGLSDGRYIEDRSVYDCHSVWDRHLREARVAARGEARDAMPVPA